MLVVEDERAVRKLVRSVLEEQGHDVHEACNGREALEYLGRHPGEIGLILTDVVMPDIGGPELARRLGSLGDPTQVMFMSGYADTQPADGEAAWALNVLHKPFTREELSARVGELLAPPGAAQSRSSS